MEGRNKPQYNYVDQGTLSPPQPNRLTQQQGGLYGGSFGKAGQQQFGSEMRQGERVRYNISREDEEDNDKESDKQLQGRRMASNQNQEYVEEDRQDNEEYEGEIQDGQMQNEIQNSNEDEQDEEEEEEEAGDEEQEQLVCVKCSQQVEQALVLQCKHKLCLDCASVQYRESCQLVQEGELPQSVECHLCGVPTPLAQNSIEVLLSFGIPQEEPQSQQDQVNSQPQQTEQQWQPQNNDSFIKQAQTSRQGSAYSMQNRQNTNDSLQYQQQQLMQQQQQQQQAHQLHSGQRENEEQFEYSNSNQLDSQQQQLSLQQQEYQQPQRVAVSTTEAQNYLQNNQFHQNILDAKQKKKQQQLQDSKRLPSISKSQEDPILYCFSCETPCFSLEDYLQGLHRNHNVKNVSKAFNELQEPIDDLRLKIKSKSDLLGQDQARLQKKREDLEEVLESCKQSIREQFNELINELKNKQNELIKSAEQSVEEKFFEIEKGMNRVSNSLDQLSVLDSELVEVYYNSQRNLANEIRAFNHYAENKSKILEEIQKIEGDIFIDVRNRLLYEFKLDTNSLKSHIDSIRRVKLEINRLQGFVHSDPASAKQKFYEKPVEDKSKELLNKIISQHSFKENNADVQASNQKVSSNSTFAGIQNANLNLSLKQNIQGISLNQQPISFNPASAKVFNPSSYLISPSPSDPSSNLSPGRRAKISLNPGTDAPKRQTSPLLNKPFKSKGKFSPPQFSNRDKFQQNGQLGFKTFSINSQSARQEFSNALQSPSSIARKYNFPNQDKFDISVLSQQQQQSSGAMNSSLVSKASILDQLNSFKRNVEEIRKQSIGLSDENHNGSNSGIILPTAEEQANIAVQNRIRLLEEKLAYKLC